jgi:hypothetical protein
MMTYPFNLKNMKNLENTKPGKRISDPLLFTIIFVSFWLTIAILGYFKLLDLSHFNDR